MKKIIYILFASCLFLASCNKDNDDVYYSDMYLAIEVVDDQGNDLLGESSKLIHQGETKAKIGNDYYYLNSQENNAFTFRHILNETDNNYLKIGCWYYDRENLYIIIDWGGDIKRDVIVFSYDSHLDGLQSSSHDFKYPYSITINGKDLELDKESGRYIYVKDINS